MPPSTQDATVSGLERFTKTFWPYILVALGLIQYIYTQGAAENQKQFVESKDKQEKQAAKVDALLLQTALQGKDLERLKTSDEKQDERMGVLETRQGTLEKTIILSNGNGR